MYKIDLKGINILDTGIVDYRNSGLSDILCIFYDCARKLNLINKISNVFIEYSTISSILVDGKMLGYACLSQKTNPIFEENVKKYAGPIMRYVQEKGISLYHHKDFISANKDSLFQRAGYKFVSSAGLGDNKHKKKLVDKFSLDSTLIKEDGNIHKKRFWSISYDVEYDEFISLIKKYPKEMNDENIEDFFGVIHVLYDKYFWPSGFPYGEKSIYFGVPTIGAIVKGNDLSGQGGIFVYLTYSCGHNEIEKLIKTVSFELDYAVKSITLNVLSNAGFVLAQKAKKEAIKSAKAAIMSRNMSHNLGSHYIANTKNYISDLANAKNDKDLRGLTHLLQYIQERMDYIATVISNDVYPLGALNIKSQIFDELTIDDCGERHGEKHLTTNFLLKYIVFSEKYSRVSTNNSGLKNLRIEINYPKPAPNDSKKKKDRVFTGKGSCKEIEDTLKLELSKLNIAVPCGIMARHALFNIIENIIRNSAKHNKENCDSELVIRLTLEKDSVNPKFLKISIHDNRGGYDSLIGEHKDGVVAGRLKELRFLKADGSLDKNNKGLKEMIISALWLKNKDVGGVMTQIDNAADGEEKYKIITQECLRIERSTNGHLAYVLDLPIYQEVTSIDGYFSNHKTLLTELNSIYADVVIGSTEKSNELEKSFDDIFPRYLVADDKVNAMSPVEKLKNAICRNLNIGIDDFEKYTIHIDKAAATDVYKDIKGVVNTMPETPTDKQICFITHFDIQNDSQKKKILEKYKRVAYLDSISGENFTSTLVSPDFLNDEYLKCKIIESALTKIAIIDERIYEKFAKNEKAEKYSNRTAIEAAIISRKIETISKLLNYITNKYHSDYFADEKMVIEQLCSEDTPLKERLEETDVNSALNILCPVGLQQNVLDKRSIYVYTIEATEENSNVIKDVSGGSTKLGSDISLQKVHFLSIHLGLVEKCKNEGGVKGLMEEIRVHFPDVRYIAIHSGRGNYSADLSSDLKDYCFITLSALEAAINNSKYMLSQLFYNMNYYGKGNINND